MDGESGYRICMMSFLIAGVVMLWTGFNYLLVSFRPDLFTPDSYNMMKIVLSLVLIIMSMLMVRRNILTEAMMLMFTGLSLFSFSASYLFMEGTGSYLMDAVYCIPILLCTVIFIMNGERLMSYASVMLSFSMIYPFIVGNYDESIIQGIAICISGVLLMYIGFHGLYSDRVLFKSVLVPMDEYKVNELLASASLLILAIYCVYTSISPYNEEFFLAALILALVSLFTALTCLQRGVLVEGMVAFTYSFSSVIFTIWNILGGTGYAIIDLAASCIIGVVGAILIRDRRFSLGVPLLVFAIITVPGFLYSEGFCWKLGSIILAAFLLYYCISRMIHVATGRKPLPVLD